MVFSKHTSINSHKIWDDRKNKFSLKSEISNFLQITNYIDLTPTVKLILLGLCKVDFLIHAHKIKENTLCIWSVQRRHSVDGEVKLKSKKWILNEKFVWDFDKKKFCGRCCTGEAAIKSYILQILTGEMIKRMWLGCKFWDLSNGAFSNFLDSLSSIKKVLAEAQLLNKFLDI